MSSRIEFLSTHIATDGGRYVKIGNMSKTDGQQATAWRSENGAVLMTRPGRQDDVEIDYHADGSATVTVNGEEHEFTAEQMENLTVMTGDGNDSITVTGDSEGRHGLTIEAGDGNDTVEGGNGAEKVYGGGGNDTINTRGGNDEVYGEDGDDKIDTGSGNDTAHGQRGDDTIVTGSGNDTADGGRGADDIDTGSGNDTVTGGDDREVDTINLGYGNDTYVPSRVWSFRPPVLDQVTDPDAARSDAAS